MNCTSRLISAGGYRGCYSAERFYVMRSKYKSALRLDGMEKEAIDQDAISIKTSVSLRLVSLQLGESIRYILISERYLQR